MINEQIETSMRLEGLEGGGILVTFPKRDPFGRIFVCVFLEAKWDS